MIIGIKEKEEKNKKENKKQQLEDEVMETYLRGIHTGLIAVILTCVVFTMIYIILTSHGPIVGAISIHSVDDLWVEQGEIELWFNQTNQRLQDQSNFMEQIERAFDTMKRFGFYRANCLKPKELE